MYLFVGVFRTNSAEQVANENKAKENNPEHPPEGEAWTAAWRLFLRLDDQVPWAKEKRVSANEKALCQFSTW